MKKARLTIMTLLLSAALLPTTVALTSCSSIEDGSYVAPITQNEKMEGKWVLSSITQVDEANQKEMGLTSLFGFDSFALQLTSDGTGDPGTFTVSGTAPALLPTSGTWQLENPFVNSDNTAARLLLNDQTRLTVTAVPGGKRELSFRLTRTSNGVAFVSYVYNLTAADDGTAE